MPLTDDELAYMRETQAEHRPTAATLQPRAEVPDGMGGTDTSLGDPQPIQVRISASSWSAASAASAGASNAPRWNKASPSCTRGSIRLSPIHRWSCCSQ